MNRSDSGVQSAGPAGREALVEMVCVYPFSMHALARQISARNSLRMLHTGMPSFWIPGVPRSLVRSRWVLAGVQRVVGRLVPRWNYPLARSVIKDLDGWAAKHLCGAPVLIAMSAHATLTLQRAKEAGTRVVCDRGSWHILEQHLVLQAEADRWGLGLPASDQWGIDRELADYETADRIFVPSEPARQSFIRRGIGADRIRKIPFGADINLFRPGGHDETDPQRVICVSSVTLGKGLQYLVPAYRRVRRGGSSLILVGPADPRMVELIDLHDSDITLTGAVNKKRVSSELRMSGIFVLASVTEGLALAVIEAMASGLPVIATDATGAADIISDGVEGFIVPTGDTDALAGALEILLADPARSKMMGKAARRKVESLGGWDAYGQRCLEEFSSLASE